MIRKYLTRLGAASIARTPFTVEPDDVFLVSYPRSGNTWVRFMVANLLAGRTANVDFQVLGRLVPDLHKDVTSIPWAPRPRIIKSHLTFRAEYPPVVYLVRDGRDVYVSYFHYRRDRLPESTTLAQFIDGKLWPCSWGDHVGSWLDSAMDSNRLLLIRYEDLLEDPTGGLAQIASFAHLDASIENIQDAVRASEFNRMRQAEEESGRPFGEPHSGRFVRRGRTTEWKNAFGENERTAFKKKDNIALLRLGYEDKTDW